MKTLIHAALAVKGLRVEHKASRFDRRNYIMYIIIYFYFLISGFSEENNDLRTLNPYVRRFARGSGGKKAYSMVAIDNENEENGDIVKENI